MKHNAMKEAIKVCVVQLICMPLVLYTYTPEKLFFWMLLLFMDSYLLKHYHVMEFGRMMMSSTKEEQKMLTFLNIGILAGYTILAFKNLALAGYLVLNDLVMNAVSIFLYMKSIEK